MIDLLLLQQNISNNANVEAFGLSQAVESREPSADKNFEEILNQQLTLESIASFAQAAEKIAVMPLPAENIAIELGKEKDISRILETQENDNELFAIMVDGQYIEINLDKKIFLENNEAYHSIASDNENDILHRQTQMLHTFSNEKINTTNTYDSSVVALANTEVTSIHDALSEENNLHIPTIGQITNESQKNSVQSESLPIIKGTLISPEKRERQIVFSNAFLENEQGSIEFNDSNTLFEVSSKINNDFNGEDKLNLLINQTMKEMPQKLDFSLSMNHSKELIKPLNDESTIGVSTILQPSSIGREVTNAGFNLEATKQFYLSQNVHDADWQPALGQKLLMMFEGGIKKAIIDLNPVELGPLNVQLELDNDKAQVVFNSSHPMTKDVLENAVTKLRDMFEAQGLELVQVDVHLASDHQHQDQNSDEMRLNHVQTIYSEANVELIPTSSLNRKIIGLIDFYA